MAQTSTLMLMPQTVYDGGGTANVYTVTGQTQPAAAYYLGNNNLQTVTYGLSSVTATIEIQASLSSEPVDNDWFIVHTIQANSLTSTSYTNIQGNFVHIRAVIKEFSGGTIQYIKVTY